MRTTADRPTPAGLVLRALSTLGPAPRSVIATHARLSPATVTSATRYLLEAGLIVETGAGPDTPRVGRPHTPLTLNTETTVAAIHFAAARTRVAVVDISGEVLSSEIIPHRSTDGAELVAHATDALARVIDSLPAEVAPRALGAATGGWVDSAAGIVHSHPFLNWEGVRVSDQARGIVHSEQLFGALPAESSALVLFVGNVIDAAFAVDGRVRYGPGASAGSLEALVGSALPGGIGSMRSLTHHSLCEELSQQGLLPRPVPSFVDVVAAARLDARVRARLVERAGVLARVVAVLVDILNPDTVIIPDSSFTLIDEVRTAYLTGIAEHSTTILDAQSLVTGTSFPGRILEQSAAAAVLRALYDDPLQFIAHTGSTLQPDLF
ncbi:hypothetical protein GII33_02575 [Gordonia pseudamarae]|jgi:predicted NBD/HSP70 family sugar kinase|uniref:ROK family protein n=1 Tax=Gordonia pseudamarae TaxID=2831662 RepID=A0ABX6IDM1_9ACTN|nr:MULTISPECIES: hypothetical protein [Gordonia]MBD0022317.1 ROK family transcriptional regulator [Gordonia sp. (in: high G+C Gram-positive bacteria)]QHN25019.1 hypothetical protein GII33_02575 [Gordonia pseudamarae]QHN33954.1 hypothetical protein GII31_02570 [Gordonia pseudamarae]